MCPSITLKFRPRKACSPSRQASSAERSRPDRVSVLQTPEDKGLARYQGAIINIDGSLWTTEFGGVRVTSIAETAGGEAAVGARVLVWSRPGHDGTLVASYARVLDQTSVITTPTPVPFE